MAPRTAPDRLADPDGFYEALMRAHEGLGESESHALNARLVLLMAAEIGDPARLTALLRMARAPMPADAAPAGRR